MKSKLYLASKYSWLAFFILVIALFVTIDSARAISYGGVGGRPAYPRPDNSRTEDIFVHTLAPGTLQEEGVLVLNNTEEIKTLMVYSADFTPSTEGGFACKQLSEAKQGVGSWLTFKNPQVVKTEPEDGLPDDKDGDGLLDDEEEISGTDPEAADTDGDGISDFDEIEAGQDPLQPVVLEVDPNDKILVPFTVKVPANVDIGEHDGCVLIQEKEEAEEGRTGIILSTRTGLRMAITIPGDIVRQLEIVDFQISERLQGGKILHPIVKNTGNVSIDAEISIATKSMFGMAVGQHGGEYAILRGDTAEWNFEFIPSAWGGWYNSLLTVEYDADPEAGTGVDSGQPKTVLSYPQVWFFVVPAVGPLIMYIAGLVFILVLILLWGLSRKRNKWIKAEWVKFSVKPGDSIKSLAQKHDVSWRLLAKVNKIKPPYELKSGSIIKVPPQDDK